MARVMHWQNSNAVFVDRRSSRTPGARVSDQRPSPHYLQCQEVHWAKVVAPPLLLMLCEELLTSHKWCSFEEVTAAGIAAPYEFAIASLDGNTTAEVCFELDVPGHPPCSAPVSIGSIVVRHLKAMAQRFVGHDQVGSVHVITHCTDGLRY